MSKGSNTTRSGSSATTRSAANVSGGNTPDDIITRIAQTHRLTQYPERLTDAQLSQTANALIKDVHSLEEVHITYKEGETITNNSTYRHRQDAIDAKNREINLIVKEARRRNIQL